MSCNRRIHRIHATLEQTRTVVVMIVWWLDLQLHRAISAYHH